MHSTMNTLKVHLTLISTHMLSDCVGEMDECPESVQLCFQCCTLDENLHNIHDLGLMNHDLGILEYLQDYFTYLVDQGRYLETNIPSCWVNSDEKWTGWMDDLWFYGPFNRISVILSRWRIGETVQMRGHNVCFYAGLTKTIPTYHQILLLI